MDRALDSIRISAGRGARVSRLRIGLSDAQLDVPEPDAGTAAAGDGKRSIRSCPSLLQKFSVASYLRHLCPVQLPAEGLLALFSVVATPVPAVVAVFGSALCDSSGNRLCLFADTDVRDHVQYRLDFAVH